MSTRHIQSKLSLLALASVASAMFVSACGGSSDGETSPPPVAVSSITLTVAGTPAIAALTDTRTITAVAKDASGANIASPTLTWTSSAPSVVTVSGSGGTATVTAVGNGTATITAASGSVQGTTPISVTQVATAVAVTGIPTSLLPGTTTQLTGEARDAKGRPIAGVTGFTFASSDQSVAVVTTSGALTAIAPGTGQITGSATVAGSALNGSSPVTVAFATTSNVPTDAAVAATANNQFTPASVTIRTGGTVTWSFAAVQHNVTFGAGAGVPGNIPNSAGADVSRTFSTAGTFGYNCTLHPGMSGTVTVQTAAPSSLNTVLNGANERPTPVTTTGNGAAMFTVNGTTVNYVVTFARLSGPPIMAHIHGPGNSTQAVGVLVDFPTTGQTLNSGVLTGSFNAGSIRNAAISLDSLLVLMRNGNAYVNVHTAQNTAGEIRGQLGTP